MLIGSKGKIMRICYSCGKEIDDAIDTCPNCGQAIKSMFSLHALVDEPEREDEPENVNPLEGTDSDLAAVSEKYAGFSLAGELDSKTGESSVQQPTQTTGYSAVDELKTETELYVEQQMGKTSGYSPADGIVKLSGLSLAGESEKPSGLSLAGETEKPGGLSLTGNPEVKTESNNVVKEPEKKEDPNDFDPFLDMDPIVTTSTYVPKEFVDLENNGKMKMTEKEFYNGMNMAKTRQRLLWNCIFFYISAGKFILGGFMGEAAIRILFGQQYATYGYAFSFVCTMMGLLIILSTVFVQTKRSLAFAIVLTVMYVLAYLPNLLKGHFFTGAFMAIISVESLLCVINYRREWKSYIEF